MTTDKLKIEDCNAILAVGEKANLTLNVDEDGDSVSALTIPLGTDREIVEGFFEEHGEDQ